MADIVHAVASGLLKELGDLPPDVTGQLQGLESLDRELVQKVLSARGDDGEPVISGSSIQHIEDAFRQKDPIEAAISVYRLYHGLPEELRWSIKRRLPPLVRLALEVNDDIDLSTETVESLIMHALELDVRGVAEIYDQIPRANRQRVLARLPQKMRRHARVAVELFDGLSPERKASLAFRLLPPQVKAARESILMDKIRESGGVEPEIEIGGAAASSGAAHAPADAAETDEGTSKRNPLQGAAAPHYGSVDSAGSLLGGTDVQRVLETAGKLRKTHRSLAARSAASGAAGASSPAVEAPPIRPDPAQAARASTDLEELRQLTPTSMEEAKVELATSSVSAAMWGQMRELGGWVAEGPCGIRVLSFLAGLFALVAAFVGIFINFADAKKTKGRTIVFVIINGWIMWFALLIVVTEARTAFCGMFVRRLVEKYLPLFTTVSGRGHLMFFVGSLALAQWSRSQFLNIISGFILMTLGLANWITSCCAAYHFAAIRGHVSSEAEAAAAFDEADLDGSGDLDTTELADLCVQLGSKLSHAELEAAIMEMDKDRDRMISKAEFLAWWSGDLRSGGGWMSAMQAVALGEEIPEEKVAGGGSGGGALGEQGSGARGAVSDGSDMFDGLSVAALAEQLKRSDEAREKRRERVAKASKGGKGSSAAAGSD